MAKDHLGTVAVLLAVLAGWQVLYLFAGGAGLASPAATLRQAEVLLTSGDFWVEARETALAFFYSIVLVGTAGIVVGFLLGLNMRAAHVAEPVMVNLYSLPKVTLYPLVLLIFGLGISARVAFGVMHGLLPLSIYTMNAIARIKPVYLRTARVMRLSPLRTAATIVWPAVLPEILTGLRLAVSLSLLGVLIGEMFASQHGLGHVVFDAMGRGDMATTLAVALLLALFAIVANNTILIVERGLRH